MGNSGILSPNEVIVEEYVTYYLEWAVYNTLGSWPDLMGGIIESDVALSNVCKLIQVSLAHSKETIFQTFREKLWGNQ